MLRRIIKATTNQYNPLGHTYFIAFNCSRQPVCFQLHKGLVLAKSTKERQLSKNNQFPILIALPIATGYSRIGSHKKLPGLLIVATQPSEKKRLYSPRHGMQAKRIYASILEVPYLRTGIDASLYDANGNALTAAPFKKNNGSSDPYHIDIGFFGQGEGSSPSEKFHLVPVNHLYIDHELQKKCSKWIPLTELSDKRTAIPGEYNQEYIEKTSPLEKNPWLNPWNNRRHIKDATRKATPYKPGKIYKAGARWDYLGWSRYATLCKPSDMASLNLQRMRALSTPSKGPCIVATAKNEAVYISHWCAYHLSIGFEHIYLYTNDNNDKTAEIAARVSMLTERVTVIRNTMNDHRTLPQFKAYKHALSVADFTLKHSWCAIIDIDEYVAIKPKTNRTASIQSYIEWVKGKSFLPPDIIALNWVFAGFDRRTGGSISTSLSSLPSRIQLSLGKNEHIKSIFRPRLFLASSCHYPLESPNCIVHAVNSEGDTYSNYHTSLEPGIGTSSIVKKAAIVHYHHKSFPEFIWKTSRCLADRPRNTSEVIDLSRLTGYAGHYFTATEKTHESSSWINSVMDTSLFKGIYEKLESDPTIKSLTEECIDMMRDRASFVASTLLAENSELSPELAILLKASIEQ